MKRNISQNARLHALLGQLGIDSETKEDLVLQFTNGRTSASSQMDVMECQYLINSLASTLRGSHKPKVVDVSDKLRKKIISRFREMNYHTPKGTADMSRINETMRNKWGKDINGYTDVELRKIIAILEKEWLPHFYKKSLANTVQNQAHAEG